MYKLWVTPVGFCSTLLITNKKERRSQNRKRTGTRNICFVLFFTWPNKFCAYAVSEFEPPNFIESHRR